MDNGTTFPFTGPTDAYRYFLALHPVKFHHWSLSRFKEEANFYLDTPWERTTMDDISAPYEYSMGDLDAQEA